MDLDAHISGLAALLNEVDGVASNVLSRAAMPRDGLEMSATRGHILFSLLRKSIRTARGVGILAKEAGAPDCWPVVSL